MEAPLRWGEVRLRGLTVEPEEVEPDLSVLEEACLSCVARVPRGS